MATKVRGLCRFLTRRAVMSSALIAGAPIAAHADCPGQVASEDTMGLPCGVQQEQEQQQRQENEQLEQQRQQQAGEAYGSAMQHSQAQQQASAAQGQQVYQTWRNRPPLPPNQNPLLGRWNSLGAPGSGPPGNGGGNDIASLAAALVGGMTAGLCDTMLSQGLIEFRPDSVVSIRSDGSAKMMYRASYRGGGSRVVVLPQGGVNFTHMIIDLDRPGHGVVAGVGCVVSRSGGSSAVLASTGGGGPVPAAASGTKASQGAAGHSPAPAPTTGGGTSGAVLDITAGVTDNGHFQPVVGREIWVIKGSADMALIDGGFSSNPYGSIMHNFMIACRQKQPECQRGLNAINAKTAAAVRTDSAGHAHTAALPPGRYYVFGTLVHADKPMVWQEPIDLHAGGNSLALDIGNAYPVD
ncbi:MAG TPA: hypothetical protein PLE54_18890 [Burkholderiaceae bacterium]|nr:hypothetical protein [Burkholderiaceae bacterium]